MSESPPPPRPRPHIVCQRLYDSTGFSKAHLLIHVLAYFLRKFNTFVHSHERGFSYDDAKFYVKNVFVWDFHSSQHFHPKDIGPRRIHRAHSHKLSARARKPTINHVHPVVHDDCRRVHRSRRRSGSRPGTHSPKDTMTLRGEKSPL